MHEAISAEDGLVEKLEVIQWPLFGVPALQARVCNAHFGRRPNLAKISSIKRSVGIGVHSGVAYFGARAQQTD